MTLRLTKQEMLRIWRQTAGLEHLNSDCTLTRFDGIDVDAMIERRMRLWYLGLLDEGDPAVAGRQTEAAQLLRVSGGMIVADESVRRIVAVRLKSWEREAVVADEAAVAGRIALQDNPYSAAGPSSPIAWRDRSGRVRVSPCGNGDEVMSAQAYVDPGEDVYEMDERALATIAMEPMV